MSRLTDILSRCLRCLYETVCVERMCQQVQLLPAVLDFTVLFFRAMPVIVMRQLSRQIRCVWTSMCQSQILAYICFHLTF